MQRRHLLLSASGVLAMPFLALRAQELPSLIRIVLPFTAGGSLDNTVRVLAAGLAQATQKTVIVDNKAGAAGVIGSSEVVRSKPDGATLLFTTGGHTVTPVLQAKLPYDADKDFTPITSVFRASGFLLLVPADSPHQSVADVVSQAKARPGEITYASAGVGNTTHLVGALFAQAAGIDLIHAPYRGAGPIMQDLLGGVVAMTFLGTSIAKPYIDGGRLRALAISGDQRDPEFPDVPSFSELGFAGVDVPAWGGVFGPAGMPPELVEALYGAVVAATARPEFVEEIKRIGAVTETSPPAQFDAYVRSELARYRAILPPLGIELD